MNWAASVYDWRFSFFNEQSRFSSVRALCYQTEDHNRTDELPTTVITLKKSENEWPLNGQRKRITVSDRFKRGPWRIWRVEVEESCRFTRSKLLCISPTACARHTQQPNKSSPNFGQISPPEWDRSAKNSRVRLRNRLDPGRWYEERSSPCCSRSRPWPWRLCWSRAQAKNRGRRRTDPAWLIWTDFRGWFVIFATESFVSTLPLKNTYLWTFWFRGVISSDSTRTPPSVPINKSPLVSWTPQLTSTTK